MFFYRWLAKLERKTSRFAIKNLMTYIIAGMAMVFVADLVLGLTLGRSLSSYFAFSAPLFKAGQFWRILTFVFLPPDSSLLFMVFALYFYYLIGTALEREWGSSWFNIYYIFGVIGTIIGGFITGYATNYYLNLSLFFAFAAMYPNFEVLLFFFIPLKIKWLALLDAALFLLSFVFGTWSDRAAIIASIINFLIFFGPSFLRGIREKYDDYKRRKKFRENFR